MVMENDKERLSLLFDGDLGGDASGELNRENWHIYSIIGDSLRDGPHHLSKDISSEVRRRLEDTANKSTKKGFLAGIFGGSLLFFTKFMQFPNRRLSICQRCHSFRARVFFE